MEVPYRHVDAFAHEAFSGNPAGVCFLEHWLDDGTLLAIARETKLPATAFAVADGGDRELRWFAPGGELELCGHATLATAYVLFNGNERERTRLLFRARVGDLAAERDGNRVALDFPALHPQDEHMPSIVASAIGVQPEELWEADGGRGLAVLAQAEQVRDLQPDVDAVAMLPFSALIVTAPGFRDDSDFVSRYFAPKHGIVEDFVTGSAHCVLTPYWARRLRKRRLFARQLSARGGELWVEDRGDRVGIAGECVVIAEGNLTIT
jgi:PhzF family phenazine biosynthesis protein